MYTPPFQYTDKIVNLVAEIMRQLEHFSSSTGSDSALRLRKENRIKTIHSSLAIEGNRLTVSQVTDILEGKPVVAPLRDIQEVKNAIATYELYPQLNPFDIKDLLRAHGTMMLALADDAGRFRTSGVGVFSEQGCVHIAPPAERVPMLVADLMEWVTKSDVHLLVRSCVFHYEFEFIHPFSDGNGRTGRLWQSLLLGQLHPVFEHLPVENLVRANQQQYYDAITTSSSLGHSTPFIEFMLSELLSSLRTHQGEALNTEVDGVRYLSAFIQTFSESFARTFARTFAQTMAKDIRTKSITDKTFEACQRILVLIKTKEKVNPKSLSAAVGVSERTIRTYLKQMQEARIIAYTGTTNNGRWTITLKARAANRS